MSKTNLRTWPEMRTPAARARRGPAALQPWASLRPSALARGFRASKPAEIGPLIAGIGAAAVLYGIRILLQAANNPKFQEAMREAPARAADRRRIRYGG